jgi:hypothetical protein
MRTDQCFLEGVTECDRAGTCESCRHDEAAWLEGWSRVSESRAATFAAAELVAATPVRQWGVTKAHKARASLR